MVAAVASSQVSVDNQAGEQNHRESKAPAGVDSFFLSKIQSYELTINEKAQNLRRLEAQRNSLNARVRMIHEELQLLQEPGSYVGEVEKVMGKKKVLVKIQPEGKYVVDVASDIDVAQLKPSLRVALRSDSYTLHKILPNKIDPLVSLMMVEKVPDSTYEMVGGLDKQIEELVEAIVLPMQQEQKFKNLGIKPPKGALMYGPPGTGKTLLARACAAQTNACYLKLAGPSLVQMFIGDGAKLVRDAFELAKEKSPAIIFIDEIDAIGTKRFDSDKSGDREVQRTMLELLNQLDGFSSEANIKVIAATNRIDILDPALLRSGRLDRKIEFPLPNEESRARIMEIHSRKMAVGPNVNFAELARSTDEMNGAQLKAVCVEAGMIALREGATELDHEHFLGGILEVQALKKSDHFYYA